MSKGKRMFFIHMERRFGGPSYEKSIPCDFGMPVRNISPFIWSGAGSIFSRFPLGVTKWMNIYVGLLFNSTMSSEGLFYF